MADPSQSEIDRQTIAAFEDLWRKTVISGTSDSVKASVANALNELTTPAGEIAQHAKELSGLGQQVRQVIAQSKAATDEVNKVAQLTPNLTRDLSLLREQVDDLLRMLSKEQGWRSRLEKWQQDSKLRDTLVALAAMPKDQEEGVVADGDDGEAEPDQAAAPDEEQGGFLGSTEPAQSHSGGKKHHAPPAASKDLWQKLALAAILAGLVGIVVGVGLGKARQDAPQMAGTAQYGSADRAAMPNQIELADKQWKYLRTSEANRQRFASYCVGRCGTGAADPDESFEAVWNSQSPPRQQRLFSDIAAASKAEPLPTGHCKSLLARANLFDSAPEFVPSVAACLVQEKYARGGQPLSSAELFAIAQRLLAFRQEAYLAGAAEHAAPGPAPSGQAPASQPAPSLSPARPAAASSARAGQAPASQPAPSLSPARPAAASSAPAGQAPAGQAQPRAPQSLPAAAGTN